MGNLVLVADAAYPFDLSSLPGGVVAVAGYVGGDTPHVWSGAEVQRVLDSGRGWWPIYTAPSRGQVLTAAQGAQAGSAMVQILAYYPVPRTVPVLLDIENGTWEASPDGARQYLTAWKAAMHSGGYPYAFGYLPWSAQFDWVANWVEYQPTVLPNDAVVGWQFASDTQLRKPFDLSIFNVDKLTQEDDLTPDQDKRLTHIEQLAMLINAGMVNIGPAIGEMRGEDRTIYQTVAQIAANEAGLLSAIQQLGASGTVDLHAVQAAAQEGATAALAAYHLEITKTG